MKIKDLDKEIIKEMTSAGGIGAVVMPIGDMQSRVGPKPKKKKSKKKKA